MHGWSGKLLIIDLTNEKFSESSIHKDYLPTYLGGRGLAVRLLWDLIEPGTDPISPNNCLILATGPLTGYPLPSSGKLVIAAKSPLTNGYGDGNIGTKASVEIRKAGYDAIVIRGAARRPIVLYIERGKVDFRSADDLWGLGTHETEDKLIREFGKDVGTLLIGPAGEKLVKYATVLSEYGRSAGRPGMGAVLGAKKVKAIVVRGEELPEPADRGELIKLGSEALKKVKESKNYDFWIRQGTMATIIWSNTNSVLPTYNFREGVFEHADKISGDVMEKMKISQKGCPNCNMPCGMMVEARTDLGVTKAELDYENVAMLGSNIGLDDLDKVSYLNNLADDLGLDTISLGSNIAFAMEAAEKKLIDEKIEWSDFRAAIDLVRKIIEREGVGALLAEGVKYASEKLGDDAAKFAIHVKGLEVSAYDCHTAPGMALAYGTSPIGAHHKDAWLISVEIQMGREGRLSYSPEKAEKLVWMQNIRGGMFESLTTCRLPWIEVGLDLEYYPKLLKAATGIAFTWDDIYTIAHRIYTLIRAFWVREYLAAGLGWSRELDIPPRRWFEESLTKGAFAGAKLEIDKYHTLLNKYYELRGWDHRGIPRRSTLEKLGLDFVIPDLEKATELSP
ncbi:MAG: aldehyde ferredoxin oxidoreductase family protein [Desulfurococcales archaeon]|nr:aldehyde ferredoxin oxidoreductase family protein [Desulfurococcales archaeon]